MESKQPSLNEKIKILYTREGIDLKGCPSELIDIIYDIWINLNYSRVNELNTYKEYHQAFNSLGVCYYNGKGVPQDYVKALEYYRKAEKMGNSRALDTIGNCYYKGDGVPQDYKKALEYYQKAEKMENSNAVNNIGDCYYDGNGVPQDYKKALEYYQKAEKMGNSNAVNNIGYCYYNGYGVTQDYKKALEYYQKAEKMGNSDAVVKIKEYYIELMGRSMTGHDIQEFYSQYFDYCDKYNWKITRNLHNMYYIYKNSKQFEELKLLINMLPITGAKHYQKAQNTFHESLKELD